MPKKHLYLPKIFSGANIDEPVSNAVWEDKQKKVVLAISDGIELDETAHTRGVSSIPDIYARPLTFLGAIRSDKHPLRKRVVQEWRGLLSLLALHKVKPDLGGLTITPVTLNEEKFSKALINLAPKNIQLQKNGVEYSWTDLLIIKFGDIPLGAFSPATLVYTSADYNRVLKDVTFSLKDENGFLKPPSITEGLDYVGEWLESFIRQFNQFALTSIDKSGDHKYVGDLNKLLDEWLSEIKKEMGIDASTLIEIPRVKPSEEPVELTKPAPFLAKYEIYKSLLKPLIKADSTEGGYKSEYALKTARNHSAYKEIVIIDERQLAQNKVLWDETRPAELGIVPATFEKFFSKPSGNHINNIILDHYKAIWVRPELYFLTPTLLKARSGDILNSSESFLNPGDGDYILPFKKELLQFFSPVEVKELLKPKFSNEKEGLVVFSFYLPLVTNQQVEVKRTYRLKGADVTLNEGVIKETEVPVLEIFPNYLGDFWCQYFMLCSDTDNFVMQPVNYEANVAITRKEQKFETNTSSNKAEIIKIAGYNSFPEAIELKPKGTDGSYGLVLLNKDRDVEGKPFNGSCWVGIDFGTSNTNIFRYSNENAERWHFSFSKYLRSVFKAPANKRNENTRLFFVPEINQELPIPTALRIFRAGVTEDLLLDQFIYFPSESRYPDNVYTDIKWDDDDLKLHSFLRSLIFLLIIDLVQERVAKIEFRCSYPKSFTDDRVRAYKEGWRHTLEGFFHKASADQKESPIANGQFIYVDEQKFDEVGDNYIVRTRNNGKLMVGVKPRFTTEGISAGEYFSSEHIIKDGVSLANKEDGSVCIDVGGGTSDYSIWFGSKIRLDASVLLAGKQIAKLIKNNSRVRDILLSEEAAAVLNEVKTNDLLFSSRLNFILRQEEKSIAGRLSNNANNKDIAWLRRILAIEFGALSFYAAHLCLALDGFLDGELADRIKENGIMLHWGGNAAKFINWIDYGRYEKDGIASKLLNGIFLNTIMDKNIGHKAFKPKVLGQIQSPGHKDEASGGIVVMNMSDDEDNTDNAAEMIDMLLIDEDKSDREMLEGLIMGERINVSGEVFEHYDVVTKETLFNSNASRFTGTELTQLERFLYLINQVGKIIGLFPEGSQINLSLEEKLAIKQRVKNDIAAMAKLKPDARIVEPVFIMEVKYLLDILSSKMK